MFGAGDVQGTCDDRFELVRAAFARNLADGDEVGASVCVTYRGEVVVDLHGGLLDPVGRDPWGEDTLVMVWSSTKGALAICAHALVSSGDLDLDKPVVHYWPEFVARNVTVAMLLNHQAGLPGLSESLPRGAVFDFEEMAARVAAEYPMWQPGTRFGYHPFTFGWLVGEVVRRVTGELPGTFFGRHVADPLGIEFWIGLPPEQHGRVSPTYLAPRDTSGASASPYMVAVERGEPIQLAVERSYSEFGEEYDSREARAANIPAANGITSARGLALLYRPFATGEPVGDIAFPPEVVRRMTSIESAGHVDAVTHETSRFTSGFMKPGMARGWTDVPSMPESAFGHHGMGGSMGYADPERELSFGYAMNRHAGYGQAARGGRLVEAIYRSVQDVPTGRTH